MSRKIVLVVLAVLVTAMALPEAAEARLPPPNINLFGFKVQFRWGDYHPLGTCVRQPVSHFHVELFQTTGGGRFKYLANLHVGSYRQSGSRCLVVYNADQPPLCLRSCNGRGGLTSSLYTAFWVILVGLGIVVSAAVVWALAAATSGALYWALP